jgi:hypothetical protein
VSLQKELGLAAKTMVLFFRNILISQVITVLNDKMIKSKTTIRQVAFDLQQAGLQVKRFEKWQ